MWVVGRNCGYTSIGRVRCEPTTNSIMEACDTIRASLSRDSMTFDMVMTEAELERLCDEFEGEFLVGRFRFGRNVAWPVVIGGGDE